MKLLTKLLAINMVLHKTTALTLNPYRPTRLKHVTRFRCVAAATNRALLPLRT